MPDTLPDDWFRQPPNLNNVQTAEGWRTYVAQRRAYHAPPLLTRAAYEGLPRRTRVLYDFARGVALSNLPKHETPMGSSVRRQIELTLAHNTANADPGVRPGLFVSADGGLGKSTLISDVAATFDEEVRDMAEIFPNLFNYLDLWLPVIWINVPAKVSVGNLGRAMLHFFGETPRGLRTDGQITGRVHTLIHDCGTRLIVLDDITRMKMHREADQDTADWVRSLQETSATIIGIGVDIEGSGLLYEGRAGTRQKRLLTQTRRRFSVHTLESFTYDTTDDIAHWVAHLKAVEDTLPLLDKTPGLLSQELPEFLFEKTGGVIGSLSTYVGLTARSVLGRAPADGGECLSQRDFLQIRLDHAAVTGNDPEITASAKGANRAARSGTRKRNSAYNGDRRETA